MEAVTMRNEYNQKRCFCGYYTSSSEKMLPFIIDIDYHPEIVA